MKKITVTVIFASALLLCAAALYGLHQSRVIPPQSRAVPQTEPLRSETRTVSFSIVPEEIRYGCPELPVGEETVLTQGIRGIGTRTVQITYRGQTELSRTVLGEYTVRPPTDTVILYGTEHKASVQTHPAEPIAKDGVLLTPDGETLCYTRILSCSATAYSCEGNIGTTAIGTTARIGAVAVDPAYIPYGTRLYIVSDDGAYLYGCATAEDCGNFRGYHIDLYFDTVAECYQFGRRSCTVYVLS